MRECSGMTSERAVFRQDALMTMYPTLDVEHAADRGDIEYLVNALTHPEMRLSAASRLGDLGVVEAVPALIRNLAVKRDIDRSAAVIALGKIGDPSAIEPLRTVANEDEAIGLRTQAIASLARLGDPVGVDLLAQLAVDPDRVLTGTSRTYQGVRSSTLSGSGRRRTRRWAVKMLRELRATAALSTLEASLGSAPPLQRRRLRNLITALRNAS
jgi:HEAT repeat protein